MSRENKIPLWMPIGVLALALFAVGWVRSRSPQPAALAPGRTLDVRGPSPAADTVAHSHSALELALATSAAPAAKASEPRSETLPPVVLLHGCLRDASGAQLPNVMLNLVDAAGHPAGVNQSDGNYVTGGLAPGRWIAHLSGQGVSPQQETLELPATPAIVQHDFIVEARRRVPVELRTPEGKELFTVLRERRLDMHVIDRLSLVATREESPRPWRPTGLNRMPASTCGAFEARESIGGPSLPEGSCGTFEFRTSPPLWMHVVLGHERVASVRIEAIPERLELVVDPQRIQSACGGVSLRVVDPQSGAALTSAHAMFGTAQRLGPMTTEGERLAVRDISPGAYYVMLTASGRCSVRQEFVLAAGQQLDLGDVPLAAKRPLQLHITDAGGNPIEIEFGLSALVPGDPRATLGRFQHSRSFQSDATGIADLCSIAPGKWVVLMDRQPREKEKYAEPALGARPRILDANCDDCPESTVVLDPTSELVLVPKSSAAIGLAYWIDTPEGLPARAGSLYASESKHLRLASGPYVLTVEDEDGTELMRRSIELGTTPVQVQLPR